MASQKQTGYGIIGVLSGFAALYCVFFIVFAVLFFLVLRYFPDTWLKYVLLVIFALVLILLAGYACYRQLKSPDTFAVKVTQELKVTIEEVKLPTEKEPRAVVSNPVPLPNQDKKALKP